MADLEKRSRDLGKINPSGFVVFRGGGWCDSFPINVRAAFRNGFVPTFWIVFIGFRVAQRGWIL